MARTLTPGDSVHEFGGHDCPLPHTGLDADLAALGEVVANGATPQARHDVLALFVNTHTSYYLDRFAKMTDLGAKYLVQPPTWSKVSARVYRALLSYFEVPMPGRATPPSADLGDYEEDPTTPGRLRRRKRPKGGTSDAV